MPKMKTHRGAAKRFKKTGTGKLKRAKAFKSHILTKKSSKRKRNLKKDRICFNYSRKSNEEIITISIRIGTGGLKMARVKRAVNSRKNHKKVLKLAKGYYGGKSKLFKTANESVIRALRNAYVGRRLKKRDFRRLWIARINAATRMNGLSYSKFMNGIKLAGVDINRKMLSEIAINDPKAFADLVELAKKQLNA